MKKSKVNFQSFFNLLLVGGLVLIFSSCARERGVVSYNSEKLRKESFEIENSRTSGKFNSNTVENNVLPTVPGEIKSKHENVVSENKTSNRAASELKTTSKEEKLNPMEKILIKKMNKKLEAGKKSARLDQNLKMALIFGAIAVIFFILGFIPFFWIFGAIALVIAVIFLLLWVLEQ